MPSRRQRLASQRASFCPGLARLLLRPESRGDGVDDGMSAPAALAVRVGAQCIALSLSLQDILFSDAPACSISPPTSVYRTAPNDSSKCQYIVLGQTVTRARPPRSRCAVPPRDRRADSHRSSEPYDPYIPSGSRPGGSSGAAPAQGQAGGSNAQSKKVSPPMVW